MEEEYVSKIILELQPRSRRGYRRLFGIRENKSFNKQFFDINQFTEDFLKEYNRKVLQRGKHIRFHHLIISIKQITRGSKGFSENTQVEYRLKGLPFRNENKFSKSDEILFNQGKSNECFVDELIYKSRQNSIDIDKEEVYTCYCCECKKCLSDGDFFIKSGNWSRPIVCLSCYEMIFTEKCIHCQKPITFDQNSLTSDGLACIRFVEHNGFYWHSDCCYCVYCLESLIGKKYYQDDYYQQLFCFQHIPFQHF